MTWIKRLSPNVITVGDVFERIGIQWRVTAHHPDGRFDAVLIP